MNTTTNPSAPSHLPAPEPRLRRSIDGSLGGVASGIAKYFGIEPKWIRLAFLLSMLMGGVGFLSYIALWLGLPDELDSRPTKFATTQNVGRLFIAGIFLIFAVGSLTSGAAVSGSFLFPALLVGGGIYLLNQRDDVDLSLGGQHPKAEAPYAPTGVVIPPPPGAPGGSVPTPPPVVEDDRDPLLVEAERLMNGDYIDQGLSANEPAHWAMTRTEAAEVKTRRKRPPIVSFALGSAALASALTFISSGGQVPGFVYPFIFLGMAVLGFVASLFFRRPAWLLLPISFFAFAAGMLGIFGAGTWQEGVGEVSVEIRGLEVPTFQTEGINIDVPAIPAVPDVPQVFSHGVGELSLNMDEIQLEDDRTVFADLNVGQLNLDLPEDVRTRVVLGHDSSISFTDGVDRSLPAGMTLLVNQDTVGPELTIHASVNLGEITIDIDSDEFELVGG